MMITFSAGDDSHLSLSVIMEHQRTEIFTYYQDIFQIIFRPCEIRLGSTGGTSVLYFLSYTTDCSHKKIIFKLI